MSINTLICCIARMAPESDGDLVGAIKTAGCLSAEMAIDLVRAEERMQEARQV